MELKGMPLDEVLIRKATNLTTGYSFVGIDSDQGNVWDASKSAYGTIISTASFALGGSENGFLHYLVESCKVQKLQGTKLQLASFGSTRLKGEGFAAAAQQVSKANSELVKEGKLCTRRGSESWFFYPLLNLLT